MVFMVAPAYFKIAFNGRSIVVGGSFQILIVVYINIETSSMLNLNPRAIVIKL